MKDIRTQNQKIMNLFQIPSSKCFSDLFFDYWIIVTAQDLKIFQEKGRKFEKWRINFLLIIFPPFAS